MSNNEAPPGGFKQTEIGLIPEEWEIMKLGSIAETKSGGTPSRNDPSLFQGGIPWVKSGELDDLVVRDTEEKITDKALQNSSAKVFPKGTLLIALYGATVGKTGILGIDATTNQAVCAIFPKADAFTPSYLQYYFIRIRPELLKARYGGAQPNISQTVIKDTIVIIPPLPEQRAIAHVLSKIQAAAQAQAAIAGRARELKRALMAKLFTEGLRRGEPLKETEMGPMPESWEVEKLGDVCAIATGTTPATDKPEYYGGNIPFIKTSEIANNRIIKAETHITQKAVEDYNLRIYPPGTVLMAMYGQGKTRGQVALLNISAATTQNTAAICPCEELDSEYLWQWLMGQYNNLRNAGALGHISHLNLGYVKAYGIPKPPLDEQREIAYILQTVDAKIATAERKRAGLEELFRAMLGELMTGRVRVKRVIS